MWRAKRNEANRMQCTQLNGNVKNKTDSPVVYLCGVSSTLHNKKENAKQKNAV